MGFQKGHKLATGRPKGAKGKATLLKEERRAIFDAQVSEMWEDTISKLRPEYIADQFLGKPTEHVEVNVTTEVSPKVQELIDAYTHKRGKTSAN